MSPPLAGPSPSGRVDIDMSQDLLGRAAAAGRLPARDLAEEINGLLSAAMDQKLPPAPSGFEAQNPFWNRDSTFAGSILSGIMSVVVSRPFGFSNAVEDFRMWQALDRWRFWRFGNSDTSVRPAIKPFAGWLAQAKGI